MCCLLLVLALDCPFPVPHDPELAELPLLPELLLFLDFETGSWVESTSCEVRSHADSEPEQELLISEIEMVGTSERFNFVLVVVVGDSGCRFGNDGNGRGNSVCSVEFSESVA